MQTTNNFIYSGRVKLEIPIIQDKVCVAVLLCKRRKNGNRYRHRYPYDSQSST